ncbi:MAG: orotate phosphoribosyltransferase [Nanobdellota archaeon]
MEKKEIAKLLLKKNAVTLNIEKPYTYSSGIRSPIYCDNRLLAAYPKERKLITKSFIENFDKEQFDIIGGTSTAGIQWAAWIAEELDKPMCYIRGSAKKHGKGKQIEGSPVENKRVLVIEDLISTGKSSIEAVRAVKENKGDVSQVLAIFSYRLDSAEKNFKEEGCEIKTLTDFQILAQAAFEEEYITREQLEIIKEWNKNPSQWGPNNGFPNAK